MLADYALIRTALNHSFSDRIVCYHRDAAHIWTVTQGSRKKRVAATDPRGFGLFLTLRLKDMPR